MSRFAIIPRRAIEDDRFSMTHLRVMCALGTFTDKHGWCFPAMSTLAGIVGVSRQRVSVCIGDLSDWGYLEVHQRRRESDGGQTSHGYRVLFDVGQPDDPPQPEIAPPQPVVVAPPCNPQDVAAPATPGGCTKNDPMKVPPSLAGRACLLMRDAGCMSTNPSHPKLLEALAAGVTPEELADVVREKPGKNMAYVVEVAHSRKNEGINAQGQRNGSGSGGVNQHRGESLADQAARLHRQQRSEASG